MSGRQIGSVLGAAIGAYFGGPAGAQLGMAIGGAIGGAVDPDHIYGPKIGDGQQQSATDGNPIAWVQGTAMIAGTIVQVGPRRQHRHKDNGKGGGPTTVTYTASQDFAILICESSELRDSTMGSVLMVIQDGKLVYDVRPGSEILADSAKWKANVDFMFGAEDQMPHPTLEAITGVNNTPAYRGSLIAVFKDFDVTQAGDRIPSFQFVVSSAALSPYDYDGGQAYPTTKTISVSAEKGAFSLVYATGAIPDKFQVWDGAVKLLDTGYHGDGPTYQSALNSALTAKGDPTETIVQFPYPPGTGSPGPALDAQWADPTKREYASFTKTTTATSLTVKAYAPLPGTGWRFAIASPTQGGVGLDAIAQSICRRGGLSAQDFDVSALAGIIVEGYPIARQATAADCLRPLLQAYFSYASEYDSQLHFLKYGGDASVVIDRADLIEGNDANEGAIVSNLRNQGTEFPRRVVGSYIDPSQNYSVVDVAAERRAVGVVAIGDQSFEIPVVMTVEDATRAVDKALKVAYATLEGKLEYSVPFAGADVYLSLAAGEPLQFQGKRYVLDEMTLGNGNLKLTTRYDRQSAYTSNVQAIEGNVPVPPTSPYSGLTKLVPMDLAAQRVQDSVGVYIAAAGAEGQDSWAGCVVQASYDGMATWQNALTIVSESVMGQVDSENPLMVTSLRYPLESITFDQAAAGDNVFALRDSSGVTHLCQFKSATETVTPLQYELTEVTRALGGTPSVVAAAGDDFTLMDAAYFLPIDPSFAGRTLYFRGVGFGEPAEDALVYSLLYTAKRNNLGVPISTESDLDITDENGYNEITTE